MENPGKESPINAAGVPRSRHLLAVFDSEEQAREAEHTLEGAEHWLLQGPEDALLLSAPDEKAGPLRRLERLAKLLAGETNDAQRYAEFLKNGKVVLAVSAPDPDTANQLTDIITAAGGYDVTYYRDWAVQYMSPGENASHNIPTHAVSNRPEIDG